MVSCGFEEMMENRAGLYHCFGEMRRDKNPERQVELLWMLHIF